MPSAWLRGLQGITPAAGGCLVSCSSVDDEQLCAACLQHEVGVYTSYVLTGYGTWWAHDTRPVFEV